MGDIFDEAVERPITRRALEAERAKERKAYAKKFAVRRIPKERVIGRQVPKWSLMVDGIWHTFRPGDRIYHTFGRGFGSLIWIELRADGLGAYFHCLDRAGDSFICRDTSARPSGLRRVK